MALGIIATKIARSHNTLMLVEAAAHNVQVLTSQLMTLLWLIAIFLVIQSLIFIQMALAKPHASLNIVHMTVCRMLNIATGLVLTLLCIIIQ